MIIKENKKFQFIKGDCIIMRKRSVGQWLALLGNLVVSIGLLLNGFEIVSHTVFLIIVLIGVIIDIVALFFMKKSEF